VQQHAPNKHQYRIFFHTALILFSIFIFSGCDKKEVIEEVPVVRPVKTLLVEAGNDALQRSLPGIVRAAKRSELSFEVSGPLVDLPIEEGQHVKKGTIIAQIQQRDFKTAVDEAKARNLEAEKQFNRYKELYARKQVSQADYDSYRAARDIARARLEDARNSLQDTTLTAPFDGIISKRFVENHQKVQAKEPIANLQDITQIEILVDVPELMMAALQRDHKPIINASFEAIPGKQYPLLAKEYSTQADPATQTYQAVLIMDQPEEAEILPGMTAMVEAHVSEDTDAVPSTIIIPAIAVMNGAGDDTFVWLLAKDRKTVHKQKVSIGHLKGSKNITIQDGLQGGDVVIVAGLAQLTEGMQVRPWEKQREGK